jgi:hypothetical protein
MRKDKRTKRGKWSIEYRMIRPCQIGTSTKTMMWFGREIKVNKHVWVYEPEFYRQRSIGLKLSTKLYRKSYCAKCGMTPEGVGYE